MIVSIVSKCTEKAGESTEVENSKKSLLKLKNATEMESDEELLAGKVQIEMKSY